MAGRIFVGASGWNYKHWRNGTFYPRGLPQSQWLEFYAERFATAEINNSFYRLPSPETFAAWAKRAPADFVYAVKASRFITHIKRLKDPEEGVALFLKNSAKLGKKLGPILFQLPPRMKADLGRLPRRLARLPRDIPVLGPFCYIRRHGATAQYASLYSDAQVRADAEFAMRVAREGRDVYVYYITPPAASRSRTRLR